MNAYQTIAQEVDGRGIATVTLNRPEKHNAMNAQMIAELTDATEWLASEQNVRAVILASTGKSFCAGGDLGWMQQQADKDRAGKKSESKALAHMLASLNALPKPLVARVQGPAYGGGVGLIAVCDIAIAAQGTKFGLTETKLGLIPATISPFIVKRMGEGFARQIFFTGKFFDTDFALRSCLISAICSANELDDRVEDEVAATLNCAPGAVADAKALCLALENMAPKDVADYTAAALADRWETEEAKLGIAAFFHRTAAPWKL